MKSRLSFPRVLTLLSSALLTFFIFCGYAHPKEVPYEGPQNPRAFELNPDGVSHLYWPFDERYGLWTRSGNFEGEGDHRGDDWYAHDLNYIGGRDGNADEDKILRAVASGVVIVTVKNYENRERKDPNKQGIEGVEWGNQILMRLDANPESVVRYVHLQNVFVSKGQHICAGAIIGKVGSSGLSGDCIEKDDVLYCYTAHLHLVLYNHLSQVQIDRLIATPTDYPSSGSGNKTDHAGEFTLDQAQSISFNSFPLTPPSLTVVQAMQNVDMLRLEMQLIGTDIPLSLPSATIQQLAVNVLGTVSDEDISLIKFLDHNRRILGTAKPSGKSAIFTGLNAVTQLAESTEFFLAVDISPSAAMKTVGLEIPNPESFQIEDAHIICTPISTVNFPAKSSEIQIAENSFAITLFANNHAPAEINPGEQNVTMLSVGFVSNLDAAKTLRNFRIDLSGTTTDIDFVILRDLVGTELSRVAVSASSVTFSNLNFTILPNSTVGLEIQLDISQEAGSGTVGISVQDNTYVELDDPLVSKSSQNFPLESSLSTITGDDGGQGGGEPPDLAITTTTLATALIEDDYNQPITVTGGTPPYTWLVQGLPAGLQPLPSGDVCYITGKPELGGDFDVFVSVSDSSSPQLRVSKDFILTVKIDSEPPPPLPTNARVFSYWPFDEGVGNETRDAVGASIAGLLNDAAWIPGFRGTGLHFGPISGYALASNIDFSGTQGTIVFWVKFDSLDQYSIPLGISTDDTTRDELYIAYRGDAEGKLEVACLDENQVILSAVSPENAISDLAWHQIAISSDGKKVRLYVDGNEQPLADDARNTGQWFDTIRDVNAVAFGGLKRGGIVAPLEGSIDECFFFDRALTSEELNALPETLPPDGGDEGASETLGNVYHVSPSADDADDGLSWGTAKHTIQAALDIARDGDTVIVADGNFAGEDNVNLNFKGKTIHLKSLNGAEKTSIDCEGAVNTRAFIFQNIEPETAVVDGFTIKNGNFDGGNGGAFYFKGEGTSPTIRNCIVEENHAEYGIAYVTEKASPRFINTPFRNNETSQSAGVIYVTKGSSAHLMKCSVTGNRSQYGAVGYIDDSSEIYFEECPISQNVVEENGILYIKNNSLATLIACNIEGNTARYGGALYVYVSSEANMEACSFKQNHAIESSGAVYVKSDSKASLKGCTLEDNTAKYGGAIRVYVGSSVTLEGCILTGNKAAESGGTIYGKNHAAVMLTNCVVANNSATYGAGCYVRDNSSLAIVNSTIADNTAISNGAGIYVMYDSVLDILNSIFWSNVGKGTSNQIYLGSDSVRASVTFTNIDGGQLHGKESAINNANYVNNIDANPAFVDPQSGNYDLADGSPCIGAGTDVNAPRTDIEGNERPQPPGSRPDMGAYESNHVSAAPAIVAMPDLENTPQKTRVFNNYPNPFNPETWIPYQLARYSYVTVTICNVHGTIVRSIDVGFKPAGVYKSKDKAVYWDGQNETGEKVSAGVYFYTLTGGNYTQTKKMVIVK